MAKVNVETSEDIQHNDDLQDIITTIPSWLLRWGISIIFGILVGFVSLAAIIKYPEVVRLNLKLTSPNLPKPIVANTSGKITKLLVKENQKVKAGQSLAYLESTANHEQIIMLVRLLKKFESSNYNLNSINSQLLHINTFNQLGELQSAFQNFYQSYTDYQLSSSNGLYLKQKAFLKSQVEEIKKQISLLNLQKRLQQKNYELAVDEFNMHKRLKNENVETSSELRQAESSFLSKQAPLLQNSNDIITVTNNSLSKQKELTELENEIIQAKGKFIQALKSLLSEAKNWERKYVLEASQDGRIVYIGLIQENQVVNTGQEIFYINSGNQSFFGQIDIPESNIGKIKLGQEVLIKLKSFPYEEYGIIRGNIQYLSEVPYRDSVFAANVYFKIQSTGKKSIQLKQGMLADAEIVTENATILQRLTRKVFKDLKF